MTTYTNGGTNSSALGPLTAVGVGSVVEESSSLVTSVSTNTVWTGGTTNDTPVTPVTDTAV
jgi:hypothetical protein